MSYNGFSEKEIKSQWETRRQAGKDGVSKKNFMVLRTPDGKPSNTCVKVAFSCELRDEYAWLLAIQDRAQELISGKKLRIPIPIRVFNGEWEQYLVMRFDENVRTIRETMDENNGLLDAARADRPAAAHAALRQAMDAPKDKSAYVTPFQSTEGWLARGFMFDDLESKRRVKNISESLGYLERAFQTAELSIPPLNPITWNHGDPSSYNWGECQDGVPFLCDFWSKFVWSLVDRRTRHTYMR